ncbi:MAG TPA: hypothetical protein VFM74_05730 [Candidatus Limnocylindria bacterium]|nr:hypothetical protein [Candidatus Limnocylindria bacterium]
MTQTHRLTVAALVLAAVVVGMALGVFASVACPTATELQPCPNSATNRAIVLALAAIVVLLLLTPFAFLAEFAASRRVRGGSWGRAMRRGLLAGAGVAALGGLRLGDALSVPAVFFVIVLGGMVEWYAIRRFDANGG